MRLMEAIIDDSKGMWDFEVVSPEQWRGLANVEVVWKGHQEVDDEFLGPFQDMSMSVDAADVYAAAGLGQQGEDLPPLFPELSSGGVGAATDAATLAAQDEVSNPWAEEDEQLHKLANGAKSSGGWDEVATDQW